MTVIAFKDGVMAADSQATYGNSRLRVNKLVRLPDGGVAGQAGEASSGQAAMSWLAMGGSIDGTEGKAFLPDISGAEVLIAKADGTLWLLTDRFPAFQIMDKTVAIGCGGDAARVALELGLSAVDAVLRVAKIDVYCGDPVQSMEVQDTHEYPEAVTHGKPRRKRPR